MLQVEVEGSSGAHSFPLIPVGAQSDQHPADMSLEGRAAAQAGDASIASSLDRLQSYHAQQLGTGSGKVSTTTMTAVSMKLYLVSHQVLIRAGSDATLRASN